MWYVEILKNHCNAVDGIFYDAIKTIYHLKAASVSFAEGFDFFELKGRNLVIFQAAFRCCFAAFFLGGGNKLR